MLLLLLLLFVHCSDAELQHRLKEANFKYDKLSTRDSYVLPYSEPCLVILGPYKGKVCKVCIRTNCPIRPELIPVSVV